MMLNVINERYMDPGMCGEPRSTDYVDLDKLEEGTS